MVKILQNKIIKIYSFAHCQLLVVLLVWRASLYWCASTPVDPVWYTCLVHLSSTPVQYTCPVHLSSTPVLQRCCQSGGHVSTGVLVHWSNAPVQCTCPMHLSNAPVQCTGLKRWPLTFVSKPRVLPSPRWAKLKSISEYEYVCIYRLKLLIDKDFFTFLHDSEYVLKLFFNDDFFLEHGGLPMYSLSVSTWTFLLLGQRGSL